MSPRQVGSTLAFFQLLHAVSRTLAGRVSGDSPPGQSQWGSRRRVTLIQQDVAGRRWDLS